MIFPVFENMDIIEGLRKKYDPLYGLVQPHITLVFPFESELSQADIGAAIESALAQFSTFSIELNGLAQLERWMFFNVTKGEDMIAKIHEALYAESFSQFKPSWLKQYTPHLTVGQFGSAHEAQKAYEMEKHQTETFACTVEKISVEIIGEKDESIIEVERRLK